MKNDDIEAAAAGDNRPLGAGTSEVLLRAEIGFWRELLNSCDGSVPADSIERMQQALALAEHRFLQLCRDRGAVNASSPGPAWTSQSGTESLH